MLIVEDGGPSRRGSSTLVRRTARPRKRTDLVTLSALVVLAALGLLNLYGLRLHSLEVHQAVTLLVGVGLFLAVQRLPSSALTRFGWLCYALSVVLLAAVIALGSDAYGARRWLTFGSTTLQPSEFAKAGLILVLAQVLAAPRGWVWRLAVALGVAAVPIMLVALEPDLSTATVLSITTLVMLVLGRIPLRALASLVGAVVILAPIGEHLLKPYQAERLHAFLSGSRGAGGSGWTILQAHIALAWGGISGQAGKSLDVVMADYLPARETDLGFASLIEQWGIRAGALAVLAAAALVWRGAVNSRTAATKGAALSAAGFAMLIATEVSVSIAANLGLLPTAGVPFPLLSYGGTAAAVHIAMAGLIMGQRAQAQTHRLWLPPRWRRPRPRLVRLTAFLVAAGLIAMLGFGWHVQRDRGDALRAAGLTQMTRCVVLPASRGEITDRHGVALARNRQLDDVWAVPRLMSTVELAELARLTGRTVPVIQRLGAASAYGLFVLVATVPTVQGARLRAVGLTGVSVVPAPRREYPQKALLGSVLGWAGIATREDMARWPGLTLGTTVGRAGLEQTYDPVLRGVDGRLCVYVDAAGRPQAMRTAVAPIPGASVRLSLDLGLQRVLGKALARAMGSGADIGSGVVMDPRNGQVLALASVPNYDDNVFGPPVDTAALARLAKRRGSPMLEHTTQASGPPGSTFKLVVASANAVHPVIPPHLVIPTGGSYTLAGHTFHNWSVLPPQDLRSALAWSNDVYFYKLAWSLGADRIISAAKQLGVGQPTGIDLPGEYAGYLGTPATVHNIHADWYPGSTVLLGIGQGYLSVTPLQDARWTAGVATGATVTPHLGLAIDSNGGDSTAITWPGPHRLPFAGALGPVRAGMRAAVTQGTALLLGSLPVAAGGKTGTAEDPSAPVSGNDSWLSAVAPMKAPVVEATAFLHGGGGSEPSSEPVRAALAYFFAHRRAIMSTS